MADQAPKGNRRIASKGAIVSRAQEDEDNFNQLIELAIRILRLVLVQMQTDRMDKKKK